MSYTDTLFMYLSIITLPLGAAILSGFLGKRLGSQGSMIITVFSVLLSTVLSYIAFYEVGFGGSPCFAETVTWAVSGPFAVSWGFVFDSLTVSMLVVVNTVASLVHIYSVGYMQGDPHISRFFSYLSLFTFFMLILVTAPSTVQLFVGWEGVGLASYLLINFWFTRIQANKAAIKAMVLNRIGDFGIILGLGVMYFMFRSTDFAVVFSMMPYINTVDIPLFGISVSGITVIALLLFLGVAGKSAQIGLHTWLPDAMEGPTPVSALIHAATMVTAGVFLLLRCSPVLEHSPIALVTVTAFGSATAFFAATTGLFQNDLKKIIAYSTCSQLGYMVFACGISSYSISMFHLFNHAFFKALLFLGAGSLIHAVLDEQDIRKLGGLVKTLPVTYIGLLVGSLSLMGIPYLAGFYSKDAIIEASYSSYLVHGHFAYWIGVISAFFTAAYSVRLLYYGFLSKFNGFRSTLGLVQESSLWLLVPIVLLSFASIFVGYLFKETMLGFGTDFWGASLVVLPEHLRTIDAEFLPTGIKLVPTVLSLFGGLVALWATHYAAVGTVALLCRGIGKTLYRTLNKKWYFDTVYGEAVALPILRFGYQVTFKLIDQGFLQAVGPVGLSQLGMLLSMLGRKLQSGYIYHYAFVIIASISFFVTIVSVRDISTYSEELSLLLVLFLGILMFVSPSKSSAHSSIG